MKKVFIKGAAMTQFGELWEKSLRQLMVEASIEAIKDSALDINEIDAIYVGNMGGSSLSGQDHLGSLIATELKRYVPSYRLEAACASGGMAFNAAWQSIKAGTYNNVLVVGVEKMTDVSGGDVTAALARAADDEYEAFFGVTFPSLYAMMAREYMQKFGLTHTELAEVSVKNHFHGSKNPRAQYQREISIEDVLQSPSVAEPLNLLDCSPISDGAAACVLTSATCEVEVVASSISTGSIRLQDRPSLTSIDATVRAAKAAYKQANISSDQIDIAEVHDCFSIAELIAYEDLGFAQNGEAVNMVLDRSVYLDGRLPVNTSGGLKSCGHPVGATGIKQLYELYLQMLGRADDRHVTKELKYGLAHNVGGSGGTSVVTILKHA